MNEAGKLFLTDARRILQDIDEAKLRAERIAHGKSGTLRIGIATAVSWHGVVVDSFRQFRRAQPDAEVELHHLISVHQVDAILSGRLDVGFAASVIPWDKDLAHWEFAQDRMVLAVPRGHALTKRKAVRLRDLRDSPFVWFPRWVNPAFYDRMMQECSRGGLSAPRIVQEAPDRDTNLGFVQCRIGVSWQPETVRWHCPRGVALVPVADMNVRLSFNLIWKKDNTSRLLQKFVAQVKRHSGSDVP